MCLRLTIPRCSGLTASPPCTMAGLHDLTARRFLAQETGFLVSIWPPSRQRPGHTADRDRDRDLPVPRRRRLCMPGSTTTRGWPASRETDACHVTPRCAIGLAVPPATATYRARGLVL